MIISTRYTFWGLCREAMSFYCETFGFQIEKMMTYGECEDLGISLNPEHKELIHSAVLVHPSGGRLSMCDSFTLLFSQDPIGEINVGHLSEKGCREGSAFVVGDLSEGEITAIYQKLVENQSIVHIPLGPRDGLKLYASVMDRYNLNWDLSCE